METSPFSRDGSGASPATRVNSDGNIEKGYTNELLYSNQPNNWSLVNVSLTGGQSGYDGSNNAWLFDSSAGYIRNNLSLSGVYTYSIYAKQGTADGVRLRMDAGTDANVYISLTDGSESLPSTGISFTATDVGSGWWKISVTANDSAFSNFRIYAIDGSGSATTGTIYIQDAMVNEGLVAQPYVESIATAVSAGLLGDMPRLDYSGGASCPSLLLEPSRTNLINQSEYIKNGAGWEVLRGDTTNNDAISPEGVGNAVKLYNTYVGSTDRYARRFLSVTASTDYVFSVYAKAAELSEIRLSSTGVSNAYAFFDLSDGTIGSVGSDATADIEDAGNGWYRCSIKHQNSITGIFAIIHLAKNGSESFSTSVGDGVHLFGAQYETGSYPTSYIPTYGSASLRGSDDCEKTSASAIIGQTEGTLFIDYTASHEGGNGERILAIGDGTASNRIVLFEASNKIRVYAADSGSLQWDYITTIDFEGTHKIAVTYAANSAAIYIDGTEIETDSSFVVPSCNNVYLGTSEAFGVSLGGTIKEAILFDSTLTDAECIALTTI